MSVPVLEGHRLSPAQRRVWRRLDSAANASNGLSSGVLLRVRGGLTPDLCKAALTRLAERHEILRTVYRAFAGTTVPMQIVSEPSVSIETRADLPPDDLLPQLLAVPRDFGEAPVVRVWMSDAADGPHPGSTLVALSVPSLCADWAGLVNLATEFPHACAELLGLAEMEPPLVQYADVSAALNDVLTSEHAQEGVAYWRAMPLEQLVNTQLPFESRAESGPTSAVEMRRELPADLLRALTDAAARLRVSLDQLLYGSWYALLLRLADQDDIAVARLYAGRCYEEVVGVPGLFSSYLPLVVPRRDGEPFARMLERLADADAANTDWQENFPWDDMLSGSARTEAASFPFQFEMQELPPPIVAGPIESSVLDVRAWVDRFALKCSACLSSDRLELTLACDPRRLDRAHLPLMADRYEAVLRQLACDPDRPIDRLDVMPASERQRVLTAFADGPAIEAAPRLVPERLFARAAATPDAIAVVQEGRAISYGELAARARALAARLREAGAGPDTLIGIALERSIELMTAILAVHYAGAAYVPLDPAYPPARVAEMADDARPLLVMTRPEHASLVEAPGRPCLFIDAHRCDPDRADTAASTEVRFAEGDDLAYVIYTSGSTGGPKGVQISHDNLAYSLAARLAFYEEVPPERFLLLPSFAFDSSVAVIFWALACGGTLVLPKEGEQRSAERVLSIAVREEATHVLCLPSLYAQILEDDRAPDATLRAVIVAGQACPERLVERHRERLADVSLFNEYGPTEATVWSTAYDCHDHNDGAVSIGGPIPGTRAYVLSDALEPVPVGVSGELYLASPGLARGYRHRPGPTAERFLPSPFGAPGERMYRTGDAVRHRPDGRLLFLGRNDGQVKVRGYRIELGEIENALLASSLVTAGVVAAIRDAAGEMALSAFITGTADTAAVRTYLAGRLPAHMVPARIVALATLPTLPNGKIDRAALAALPDAPAEAEADAGATPIEDLLRDLWSDLLRQPTIRHTDNFFEIGGHSLLAAELTSRIRTAFQIDLTVATIFEAPRLRELASRIETAIRRGAPAAAPITPRGRDELPLSYAQQRMWLLEQVTPGTATYNVPLQLWLDGALDVDALRRGLSEIVRRHEPLRTRIVARDGVPVAVLDPPAALDLPVEDVSGAPDPEAAASARARENAETPFHLAVSPPLRVRLVRVHAQRHLLLATLHHGSTDGWSTGVLARELSALYEAFTTGAPSPLPPLSVQYGDYAAWQRQVLAGDGLSSSLAYWHEQLAGVTALTLPGRKPRPADSTHRGALVHARVAAPVVTALRAVSRREQATLFMTLLASFTALLARYTGESDIAVGTPIAGRNRAELEPLIGCFVNTLVLRTAVAPGASFAALVRQTRRICLDAYAHQDVPFDLLVDALQPVRDGERPPLTSVLFAFHNHRPTPLRLGTLQAAGGHRYGGSTKYDLSLSISENDATLSATLEYDADLFSPEVMDALLTHWQHLLEQAATHEDTLVSDLDLLAADERQQLLESFRGPAREGDPRPLHALVEEQARSRPDATAITFDDRHLSYGELDRRSNQVARGLRDAGVAREDVVAVALERSLELSIALLGILKAGAAWLPLDRDLAEGRRRAMLDASGARLIIGSVADAHAGVTVPVRDLASLASPAAAPAHDDASRAAVVDPSQLAYVIFTSGSTGEPKGAANTHGGIVSRLCWMQDTFGLTTDDVVLQKTPASFDVSVWELFWPLITGARLCYARPGGHRDPEYLVRLIADEGVTTLHFVPSMLRPFLAADAVVERCRSLRYVMSSGEALTPDLVEACQSTLAGASLENLYGPTEAAVDVTHWSCARRFDGRVPIGKPIANIRTYVLDERLAPCPPHVPGELWIGGVGVARGYCHRPALTADRFRPDPFDASGARMYRTGDVVRLLTDGNIDYQGRRDFQVKIRGWRVECGDVEALLLRHEAVADCAVIAGADASGATELWAYVAPARTGASLAVDELRAFARQHLPDVMVPRAFVVLDSLPRTTSGKTNRRALPAPERAAAAPMRTPPRTRLERHLCEMWSALLGVGDVGVTDSFFELGGHSLLATQLAAHVRTIYQAPLPVRAIFDGLTVAQLAEWLLAEQSPGEIDRILDALEALDDVSDAEIEATAQV